MKVLDEGYGIAVIINNKMKDKEIYLVRRMKKKVNTLTFHGVLNHGAVLQAYALQKFLINNGFHSELINYKPLYFTWQVLRPAKGFKKSLLKYSRLMKFKRFSKRNLYTTKKTFGSVKSFEEAKNFCDVVVCGSDQIWNKDLTGGRVDDVFLQNYKNGVKKIAYAASAGPNHLSDNSDICDALLDFSSIGVRESHLVYDLEKIEKITDPILVVDPTLLLNKDSYKEICISSIVPKENFIVSYEVGTDETRVQYELFVSKLKELIGLPVYHIGDKPIKCADKNILDISPSDWLSFFNDSEIVITNSFHGTAFGVNFKKPLFVLSHCDNIKNVRIKSFLDKVDMSKCFISSPEVVNSVLIKDLLSDRDCKSLDFFVSSSKTFLLEAIEK